MKAAKNILHLMGMDSTKYGGIERFNVELSRQLVEKGYHSVFIYERWPDVEQFAAELQQTGAEIVVLNSRKNPLKFCLGFWQLLRQYNFCMMHAHFTKARFYGIPLALLYGIRNIVYTIHSTVSPILEIKRHTRAWYAVFNRYCRIVAVSQDIEENIRKNWPSATVENLYLGINPCEGNRVEGRKKLQLQDDTLMVMCTANFNQVKGLDILAKAVAKLRDANALKNAVFYIVGQPDKDREELQQLLNELDVASFIHMEGISNQIPQYLSAADIYIQPSRQEGIGLALMEACAAGLPIIASRVGGIPEVAVNGENAILVESENVDAFAAALEKLLMNSSLRRQLGQRSKMIYEDKFQLSNNVENLIEYYQLN